MFHYDKTKTYTFTNDQTDIDNWIGCRMPLFLKMPTFATCWENKTEEEVIEKISKFFYFLCVFQNTWKELGATDTFTKPIENGVFLFTAVKGKEVLKQTTLVI